MGKDTQKIYCYVDESGQDTAGRFFIVAVIVAGEERELLERELEQIETESLKGIRKWKTSSHSRRTAYMEMVLGSKLFRGKISCAVFSGRRDYQEMTIIATAQAIHSSTVNASYQASVYIDGLGIDERFVVGTGLRSKGISVSKVRGLRDESNSLIRLADGAAGFMRDGTEGNPDIQVLYKMAIAKGWIKRL